LGNSAAKVWQFWSIEMSVNAEQKSEIVKKYQRAEGDTGSPEVQVAILSARIQDL